MLCPPELRALWRRGRDSNPGQSFWPCNRLAGGCLRPTRPPLPRQSLRSIPRLRSGRGRSGGWRSRCIGATLRGPVGQSMMRAIPAHHSDPEEWTMRRMRNLSWALVGTLAALALHAGSAHAQKKTLVVALNQDPDILDPTLARTYVGRIVFSQICEKLYEIDESLRISPQLAADMPTLTDGGRTVTIKLRPGVKFNDGTPMTAEAVKFSLDRHRELKGSTRASELAPVEAVEVVDPLAV